MKKARIVRSSTRHHVRLGEGLESVNEPDDQVEKDRGSHERYRDMNEPGKGAAAIDLHRFVHVCGNVLQGREKYHHRTPDRP